MHRSLRGADRSGDSGHVLPVEMCVCVFVCVCLCVCITDAPGPRRRTAPAGRRAAAGQDAHAGAGPAGALIFLITSACGCIGRDGPTLAHTHASEEAHTHTGAARAHTHTLAHKSRRDTGTRPHARPPARTPARPPARTPARPRFCGIAQTQTTGTEHWNGAHTSASLMCSVHEPYAPLPLVGAHRPSERSARPRARAPVERPAPRGWAGGPRGRRCL